MEYVKYFIYFCYISCIECKSWYPSTVITKLQSFNLNNAKNDQESQNLPVYISKQGLEFKPSDLLQISLMNSPKIPKVDRKSDTFFSNVENLKNTSNRLQGKLVRRRYPQTPKQKYFNSNRATQSRILEVFEVVQFEHIICISSTGLEGTCLHEYDCQNINGTAMGACADGYGTCCIILLQCDTRSAATAGWFTNPNYPGPSTDRLSCTFTLDKTSAVVKQLRLDFMTFEILPPTAGTCEQDQFSVTGQNVNNVIPILCGINSGQHMYIEVSESVGPITFSFQTVSSENRLFAIKITQINSDDALSAPSGCLQYFKEDHGYIESFNYRDNSEIGIIRTPSYLNNLNYAMCIERKPSSCSVTYTNVGDMQIVNYDTERLPILPPQQAGVEIFDCPSDWLLISALRLCGERLNDGSVLQDFSLDAPVTDIYEVVKNTKRPLREGEQYFKSGMLMCVGVKERKSEKVKCLGLAAQTSGVLDYPHEEEYDAAGPIIVWFRTDGIYSGRGFRLHYRQNNCTT